MNSTAIIRSSIFLGALLIFMTAEALTPRRSRRHGRLVRWPSNLGLIALNNVIAYLVPIILPTFLAVIIEEKQWGVFHVLGLPFWLNIIFGIVFLDMVIYWQHRIFHETPFLWKIHRMHHMDQDIDVTTALRFHPFEIWFSLLVKSLFVGLWGFIPATIIVFEVILNAAAMFNHANWRLPLALDGWLRKVIVTPDMHRVHHSTKVKETNSNYGFNLSIWDHLFKSYKDQPDLGHDGMNIGLKEFQNKKHQNLLYMLVSPFLKKDLKDEN